MVHDQTTVFSKVIHFIKRRMIETFQSPAKYIPPMKHALRIYLGAH